MIHKKLVLFVLIMASAATSAYASNQCSSLNGRAFGLCTAYCEGLHCQDNPNADAKACETIAFKLSTLTGNPPPCAVGPSVALDKRVNGTDVTNPSDLELIVGDQVTFSYIVLNSGNTPLTNIVVNDTPLPASGITCENKTTIQPGEKLNCSATDVVKEGVQTNQATVQAVDTQNNTNVSATDGAGYLGLTAALTVKKQIKKTTDVSYIDADTEPGLLVDPATDQVVYRVLIQNTGTATLHDLQVTDQDNVGLNCTLPSELAPGGQETEVCTSASITPQEGVHTNTVVASAKTPSDSTVNAQDVAVYTGQTVVSCPCTFDALTEVGTEASCGFTDIENSLFRIFLLFDNNNLGAETNLTECFVTFNGARIENVTFVGTDSEKSATFSACAAILKTIKNQFSACAPI